MAFSRRKSLSSFSQFHFSLHSSMKVFPKSLRITQPHSSGSRCAQLAVAAAGSPQRLVAFFMVLVLACFSSPKASAQASTFGLSLNDLQSIVQQSIDLPALQQYYPVNADNSLQPLNIVQLPLALPTNMTLIKGSNPVNLIAISRAQFSTLTVNSYAMFRSIEASGTTANVRFNYFYKTADQSAHTVFVTLEFQNSTTGWNIVNSTVNASTL
jgi:hypothetical protein